MPLNKDQKTCEWHSLIYDLVGPIISVFVLDSRQVMYLSDETNLSGIQIREYHFNYWFELVIYF
jgi:hypothetical protein